MIWRTFTSSGKGEVGSLLSSIRALCHWQHLSLMGYLYPHLRINRGWELNVMVQGQAKHQPIPRRLDVRDPKLNTSRKY